MAGSSICGRVCCRSTISHLPYSITAGSCFSKGVTRRRPKEALKPLSETCSRAVDHPEVKPTRIGDIRRLQRSGLRGPKCAGQRHFLKNYTVASAKNSARTRRPFASPYFAPRSSLRPQLYNFSNRMAALDVLRSSSGPPLPMTASRWFLRTSPCNFISKSEVIEELLVRASTCALMPDGRRTVPSAMWP